MQAMVNDFFGLFVSKIGEILFYEISGFPLIVIVLLVGSLVFSFYFRFINIRGFKHSIDVIRGKYDNPDDIGQINHFQALTSALSGTIGLGNIAGVALAVTLGGPGAVFWMMFIAIFSMSAKFVSGSLSQIYRKVNDDGTIDGGPMYYLDIGLSKLKRPKLGKILGTIYAVFIIGGSLGGGNMFQSNQSFALLMQEFPILEDYAAIYGLILAILVGSVIIGGISRIGKATEKIVPLMVAIYVSASLYIIFTNIGEIPVVISTIINEAFTPSAIYAGGFVGVLVTGIRRAVFSNEGGVGSASIAHAAAKTDEPIREGIVAMIGPFIDTIVICFMTASVIIITKDDNPDYQIYYKNLHYDYLKIEKQKYVDQKISLYNQHFFNMLEGNIHDIDNNRFVIEMDKKITPLQLKMDSIQTDLNNLGFYFAEKYSDFNLNGKYDIGENFIDKGNGKWDEGELWTDNGNGVYDLGEKFVDKGNGMWDEETKKAQGAPLTSSAFASQISWFSTILTIIVFLFAYSTLISWYYYGDKSWKYLFGQDSVIIFKIIYLSFVVLGAITSLSNVMDFSDMMILSCAFPNIIGCMFLLPTLREKLNDYWSRYNQGKFKVYK